MDDLKTLLADLNSLNLKAAIMSEFHFDKDTPLYFEIEFARKHIEDSLNSLEKSLERQERKVRAG
jgi:hypothetical protein